MSPTSPSPGAVAPASAPKQDGASDDHRFGCEVVTELAHLEALVPAWNALADAVGNPAAFGSWQLAWWHRFAPADAQLRVVVVRRGERLVGLGPFYAHRPSGRSVHYALLASSLTHRVEPLALPGAEAETAAAIARALASAEPRVDCVDLPSIDAGQLWLTTLRRAWPGLRAPWTLVERTDSSPSMSLELGSFDAWMRSHNAHFRERMRRAPRRFAKAGGTVRRSASLEELDRDVATLVRLHQMRWDDRGGGSDLDDRVGPMLRDAGAGLLADGRLRLYVAELEGRAVAAQLVTAAGGRVAGWNGGFDPAARKLQPSIVTLLAVIEDSFERGDRLLDMGAGNHPYKLRFADGDLPLAWAKLVPRNRRYALTRAEILPRQLRTAARDALQRLPQEQRERVEALRQRRARAPEADPPAGRSPASAPAP